MEKSDFWNKYAESMELSIEGNRLIAQEVAELVRSLWHRAVSSVSSLIHSTTQRQHLPPV